MTNKEFWQLKKGDVFYDSYSKTKNTIIKREVLNEPIAFVVNKDPKKDRMIYSDFKYVQLTVQREDEKLPRYYDSIDKYKVSNLKKLK